jgi:hypothetical protein
MLKMLELEEAPAKEKTADEVHQQVVRIAQKLADRVAAGSAKQNGLYDRLAATGGSQFKEDGSVKTSLAAGDVFKDGMSGVTVQETPFQTKVELTSLKAGSGGKVLEMNSNQDPQLEQAQSDGDWGKKSVPSAKELISVSAPILEDIRSKTDPIGYKESEAVEKSLPQSIEPVQEQKAA